jgi:uncharacterized protein YqjF (DUF2071 family)
MAHPALRSVAHRPQPLPERPWVMAMRWHDLAFLHWPVAAERLRHLLPPSATIDEFDGTAWLGVVPFRMRGVRARLLPPLPGCGAFPELNVRTYVRHAGLPAVWFFSLDAASRTAVRTARAVFGLPYFDARMRCVRDGDAVRYASERTHRGAPAATLAAAWHARGGFEAPRPGSLPHWLVERYAMLLPPRRDRLRVGHVHHAPWRLAPATVELQRCDMTRILGFDLTGPPALAHAAAALEVVAWPPAVAPGGAVAADQPLRARS